MRRCGENRQVGLVPLKSMSEDGIHYRARIDRANRGKNF
jgi:hypothetical protein